MKKKKLPNIIVCKIGATLNGGKFFPLRVALMIKKGNIIYVGWSLFIANIFIYAYALCVQ